MQTCGTRALVLTELARNAVLPCLVLKSGALPVPARLSKDAEKSQRSQLSSSQASATPGAARRPRPAPPKAKAQGRAKGAVPPKMIGSGFGRSGLARRGGEVRVQGGEGNRGRESWEVWTCAAFAFFGG